jgi:ferrous iron transport protein B
MNLVLSAQSPPCLYDPRIEKAIELISARLDCSYGLDRRAIALLLLQGDNEIGELVSAGLDGNSVDIADLIRQAQTGGTEDLNTAIAIQRRDAVKVITALTTSRPSCLNIPLSERLSRLCMSPITGIPILALILWFGLYQFVGVFGGKTLVDLLENGLFGKTLNPWMTLHIQRLLPLPWLSTLFVGDYGLWTLGVTYAVALIFPIVGTFFLAFSVLEDTGYLPRLAMLIDRLFKAIGLNGKAVIPMVLGFGCDTMATIVTRILETRRERIIATFLLSLAIPCSAQIGVMTALLAGHPTAFALWLGVMSVIFVVIGWLTAKLLPGEPARFAMEIPPLRFPSLGNIASKTLARMQWYFMEVFPLFLIASLVIWAGQLMGVFHLAVRALTPVVHLLGLPGKSAEAFLFGFFRRDYGAAGLYRLQESGGLTGNQLLVSVVTLTIFLPCIAQFMIIKKERGNRMAVGMAAFIFPFAIAVGAGLNWILGVFGARL